MTTLKDIEILKILKEKNSKMSEMQKIMQKSRLPPKVPRTERGRQKDFSPVEWNHYFKDFIDVKVENNSFRCYRTERDESNEAVPALVLLHGGGYNGLTWAVFSVSL